MMGFKLKSKVMGNIAMDTVCSIMFFFFFEREAPGVTEY